MPISTWRRSLHWLTALAVLLMLPLGIWMTKSDLTTPTAVADSLWKFSLHKTVGVIVAALTVFRLFAMVFGNGFVPSRHGRLENALSAAVQSYFIIALVTLPATGLLMHFFSQGAAPIWFVPDTLVKFSPRPDLVSGASAVHEFIAKGMIVALVLHLAGALKHQLIDRDASLARMVTGNASDTLHANSTAGRSGGLAAGALLAVGVASAGMITHNSNDGPAVDLSAGHDGFVSAPQSSEIRISAVQGGDQFEAVFERFEVRYSGHAQPESLEVSIDSASFRSGMAERDETVSGADWLDAAAFPVATWTATAFSSNSDGSWTATGSLEIRGVSASVPVSFTLMNEEDHKRLKGSARFDRFDVQLGRGEFGTEDSADRTIDVAFDIHLVLQ